jgi:gliding motility-associated lipoprotein GldD
MKVLKMLLAVIPMVFFVACNSEYTSKKTGYFKIDLPQHSYQTFNDPTFPYSFEYPVYGNIVKDSTYFEQDLDNPYWINVDFPRFNARVFLSYKSIGGRSVYKVKTATGYRDSVGSNSFDALVADAFKLTYKNDIKAENINEVVVKNANGASGMVFYLGGSVATANQFFLTDSTRHFLRGALYFAATPNADSLKPVNDFLQEDVRHLINTLKWK